MVLVKIDETIASMNAKHRNEMDELGEELGKAQEALKSADSNAGRFIAELQGQVKSGRVEKT